MAVGRILALKAEVVEKRDGLWCTVCAKGTGIGLTMALLYPGGRLVLAAIRRCVECGADTITEA